MNEKKAALAILRTIRSRLTRQQTQTIRGQILSGEIDSAIRGMKRLCLNNGHECHKAGDGYEPESSMLQV